MFMLADGFIYSFSLSVLNRKAGNNKINLSFSSYMRCTKLAKMQKFCSRGMEKLDS